jgi:TPR repeat protein
LAVREHHPGAQRNVGLLYKYGLAVPQNYMCALKWYLKAAEQNSAAIVPLNIGALFENGRSVPRDRHKALEWYCHGGDNIYRNRLKNQGYHRSSADKSKFNSIIDSLY